MIKIVLTILTGLLSLSGCRSFPQKPTKEQCIKYLLKRTQGVKSPVSYHLIIPKQCYEPLGIDYD